MKYSRRLFILLFFTLLSVVLYCQEQFDHLEPMEGIYSQYANKIGSRADSEIEEKLLFHPYHPLIRFIKMPAFEKNSVLDLHFDDYKYHLLFIEIEKKEEENFSDSKIYKSEIDSISALRVKSLFEVAIDETKYYVNESEITYAKMDGTINFFIINEDNTKGGQTWSPHKNTIMGKLVAITSEIIELVKKEEPIVFDESLAARIERLKTELVQKP